MESIKNKQKTFTLSALVFFLLAYLAVGCESYRWQKECIHSHICCDVGCKCCSYPQPKLKPEVFQPNKELFLNFPVLLGNELNPDYYFRIKGKIKRIKEYKSFNTDGLYVLENITKYSKGKVTYFKHYISNNSIEEESSFNEYLFKYDSLNNLKEEKILYVDKGDTIFRKKTKDLNRSILKLLDLKKLKTNEKGQVTSYQFRNDTVFCTYNKLGQKKTETIEVTKDLKYINHSYTYSAFSVAIKTNYQFVTFNTEYKFDNYGNWIEKKTVYENNSGINTFSKRIIEYI